MIQVHLKIFPKSHYNKLLMKKIYKLNLLIKKDHLINRKISCRKIDSKFKKNSEIMKFNQEFCKFSKLLIVFKVKIKIFYHNFKEYLVLKMLIIVIIYRGYSLIIKRIFSIIIKI